MAELITNIVIIHLHKVEISLMIVLQD